MATSIAWGTKIIHIPRADMALIQASPEIRELNLNAFRLGLKNLEDSEDGMPFANTHTHNTEVTLSGLTYARVVEVINGYTVEFEDAQYAVNCVGANHNLSDVKVANQVSLIVNNAAGLITNAAIEYSSFNGGVTIDVANGVPGSVYNIGTLANPVNNIPDGLTIANAPGNGFEKFHVHGNLTLGTGHNVDGFEFEGHSPDKTTITIETAASTVGCEFTECTLTGVLDGDVILKHCTVNTLDYVNGEIRNSNLIGPITLGGGANALFIDCGSAIPTSPPIIDMGGSGQTCVFHDYSGGLYFRNMTGSNHIGVQLDGGKIILENTITSGTVIVVGVGLLLDTLGNPIATGTWNGGVTVKNYLVNTDTVASAVWSDSDAVTLLANVEKILGVTYIKEALINDLSATSTKFITTFTETGTFWLRSAILFLDGQNAGLIRGVKTYNGTTKEIQLQTPLAFAPADGDKIVIISARKFLTPDVIELAQAVWSDSSGVDLIADVKKLLGLSHENIYIDQTAFDGDHNLLSARVRIYSVAGSVGTATDVIDTYIITAAGSGPGEFSTFKQVKQ